MDTIQVEDWAIKIASEVAPNEVDLAPDMTLAFLESEEARAELYTPIHGGALGGFGAGDIQILFPVILNCIAAASTTIVAILCAPQTATILTVIKDTLEIKEKFKRDEKVSAELPAQDYQSLRQTLDIFAAGLKAVGYPQDQCDILTYRFMRVLLEKPESAHEFIKPFTAPPAPKTPKKSKSRGR